MSVLGISASTHDVAAALIGPTAPLCIVEEERFSRQRHHDGFAFGGGPPRSAVVEATAANQPTIVAHGHEIDHAAAEFNLPQRRLLSYAEELDPGLGRTMFFEHHACHAASTFFTSGFDRAYVCTLDSRGDGVCATVGIGQGHNISRVAELTFRSSPCAIYSYASELLGLGRRKEGTMMALASLESPSSALNGLIEWTGRRFQIGNLDLLTREASRTESLEGKARIASAVQSQFEEAVIQMMDDLCVDSSIRTVALAGGGFLNCALNGRINRDRRWDKVHVVCSPGDSGVALGAALLALPEPGYFEFEHAFWGSGFGSSEVEKTLNEYGLQAERVDVSLVARLLDEGEVGAFFHGKMEFGPRALGHRSMVGDPRRISVRDRMNKIKGREPWRPVSPAVIHERGPTYFEDYAWAPYMSFAFKATEECRRVGGGGVHADGTSRCQSVDASSGEFFTLIGEFERRTGVGMILNTSLNVGSPIVRTPSEAIATFYASGLDFAYIEGWLLRKPLKERGEERK